VTDDFELERFVEAQDRNGTYDTALDELRRGRKRSHWMWFVFPQIAGLGTSPMAQHYAISGADEARAYAAHEVLGPRLVACAEALLDLETDDAEAVLGGIDSVKLRSSMTLFAETVPDQAVFANVLDRFFGGARDEATLQRLKPPVRPMRSG
jgi:uncharacterized protein (DUF1810 family)